MIAAVHPIGLKDLAREFFWFGIKQAQACIFGGAMLAALLATRLFWQQDWPVARYDFLFFYALAIQFLLVAFRMELAEEVKVIFVFHVVGTVMELFKTHMGCWEYPEASLIRIGGVPLFSGFMYSAVGSYIARVWRIFHFRFENYPRLAPTVALCALIYINFFTHHYVFDIRPFLFAATFALFFRTKIYFRPDRAVFHMPLLLGWLLVSLFIWFAENFGTLGKVWVYPNQHEGWHLVSPEKIGSWFLLMIISFVLVTLLHREALEGGNAAAAEPANSRLRTY